MGDLSKKIVFITGITGFTGVHLENFFLSEGWEVFGTTFQTSENKNHFLCDITKKGEIKKIIKGLQPNYIVHTAAVSFVEASNKVEMYKVNVFGTLNLLDAIIESNINPEKIIIVSSAAVYGNIGETLSEDLCPHPINHYGNSKLVMENLIKAYFSKLNVIITRPFNYTGVGQSLEFLIPKIVSHFKNKKSIIELGNLEVYREFNDVDYLVRCYYKLLLSEDTSEIVNICTGRTNNISEVLSFLEKISNHKIEIKVNPKYIRKNEIKILKGDSSKLFSLIGNLSKNYSLEDTLTKMFNSETYR
ncbi:GDP-mannose 4,6-dehydratase [uncultured Aquimarina sp.]|uniref:GDP-mannose 4,6-dehydratase n=1 Tax=uncultured Aquimarina sp. TaxID=575652 RepID=UPI00262A88F6|nr:GDP-mannose 4,6-dehydratase [uncultured Aquimarina sp.]